MLGNTVTVTVNAVAKTLRLINQDGYSSEYLLKEATQEFRMNVRHSKEKNLVNGKAFDRHNVELTQYVYPTTALPSGCTRIVYIVIRNATDDSATDIDLLSDALADFVKTNAPAIVGWES